MAIDSRMVDRAMMIVNSEQAHEALGYTRTTNPKDLIGLTKAPLRLVPPALVIETAPAMANGASKYGAYNWREHAVSVSVYLEALMRHVLAYWDGEEVATDSGVKHLAHASACLAIIFDAAAVGKLIDDRPLPGGASALLALQARGEEVVHASTK